MALSFHLFSPKLPSQSLKFQTSPFPSNFSERIKISSKKINSDAELASELATEVEKLNTRLVQREEAIKKSTEMLFRELSQHMGMEDNEVKKKWKKMDEDKKLGLVKGFVSEWRAHFHPLSAKSIKEMIDDYLVEDDLPDSSSVFPNLKKIMGLS